MAKNVEFKPCIAVPPGETLKEHLEDIDMSQADLAKRTGLTTKHINEIINGKASISQDTSLKLENVLGIPASFWNNLEASYQETKARLEAENQILKEAEIAKHITYAEIAKLNWVKPTKKIKEKVINLRSFFGVASLKLVPNVIPVAFRKSSIKDASALSLATWLRRGEILSQKIETRPFNKDLLKNRIDDLRRLTLKAPEDFCSKLESICALCGVAVVFVPHIKGTYAHGATKWLSPQKAMIQLSIRGSYSDIFWFSFFHELGHVLLHSKKQTFIADKSTMHEAIEQEADEFASNTLIPPKEYSKFLSKKDFTEASIHAFAKGLNIHSGVVIGRLQHDEVLSFNQYSYLRTRYVWKNN